MREIILSASTRTVKTGIAWITDRYTSLRRSYWIDCFTAERHKDERVLCQRAVEGWGEHIYDVRGNVEYVLRIFKASRMPVAMTSHLMMPPKEVWVEEKRAEERRREAWWGCENGRDVIRQERGSDAHRGEKGSGVRVWKMERQVETADVVKRRWEKRREEDIKGEMLAAQSYNNRLKSTMRQKSVGKEGY